MGGYPITPEAGRVAVEEAATRSYQEATEHLGKTHGVRMGKQMLEHVTRSVGQYWLAQDQAALEQFRATRQPPAAAVSAERCVVFADGVMAHTDGDWHEARVGTVRSEGAAGRVHKSSIVRVGDMELFGEDLWRKACEMGYRQAETTAFVGDGSHWLWTLADRHFQRAEKIVDFWHVCEHVGACAKVYFGEGTDETRQWSMALSGTLRAGAVDEALGRVERLRAGRSWAKREAKHSLVTYLTNNRPRMNYPRYEALGLPIGSGEVEAQCKTLVQARCKQAGMRWSSAGLEPLLRVRCAVKDGSYDDRFGRWPTNLAAWEARRRRAARKSA